MQVGEKYTSISGKEVLIHYALPNGMYQGRVVADNRLYLPFLYDHYGKCLTGTMKEKENYSIELGD